MLVRILTTVIIFVALSLPITAQAKVVIWGEGESLHKISDLPDQHSFRTTTGYFDLGIIHGEFSVFFLPLMVYDARWIGYVDDSSYVELREHDITYYLSLTKTSPKDPASHIPFWNRFGGKLILIPVFILIIVWWFRWSRKKEPVSEGD